MEKKTYTYDYPMASITADMGILRKNNNCDYEILLIKRKNEPYKDCWALPGGFMEMNETLKECAIRELYEETGITLNNAFFVRMLDSVDRDPRGRVISGVFYGYVPEDVTPIANDDAKEVKWFTLKEVKNVDIAFDHLTAILDIYAKLWE